MSERILDIGIGKGGDYITRDPKGVMRVGLDLDPDDFALESIMEHYGTPSIKADASGEVQLLPFSENAFNHIDVIFPHNELLNGLCFSSSLWQEFNRVLKNPATVVIVIDVSTFNMQSIEVKGKYKTINSPQDYIAARSKMHGFETSIRKMNPSDTKKYGTYYANAIAQLQENIFDPTFVFLINGQKIKDSF